MKNINQKIFAIGYFLFFSFTSFAQVPPETSERLTYDQVREEIVEFIKEHQSEQVKNSINQYDCFTSEDYKKFVSDKIIEKIIEKLKKDEYFRDLVNSTSQLNPRERRKLIREAKNTYERTWSEIGEISSRGQTDEGSKAEKEIASAIAKLLEDLAEAT